MIYKTNLNHQNSKKVELFVDMRPDMSCQQLQRGSKSGVLNAHRWLIYNTLCEKKLIFYQNKILRVYIVHKTLLIFL